MKLEKKKRISEHVLRTLGANLLGNILAGKGINGVGERVIRANCGNKNKMDF